MLLLPPSSFFFFNDTATTEIYTLSLHDALPISQRDGLSRQSDSVQPGVRHAGCGARSRFAGFGRCHFTDRKSTRLNSSHLGISYAVFCLKKKKNRDTFVLPRLPGTPRSISCFRA